MKRLAWRIFGWAVLGVVLLMIAGFLIRSFSAVAA